MKSILPFVIFIAISLGGGMLIGMSSTPDAWYAALDKPAFNPPGWLFGPVWAALYVLIGIAGALVWRTVPGGAAFRIWIAQMLVNFAWSPIFFSAHQIGLALIVIVVLLGLVLAFIAATWRTQRVAALCFAPYAAWVGFATILNATLWAMN